MLVRRATASDVEAVRAVGRTTWPATYAFAGDDHVVDGLRRWWSTDAVARSIDETLTFVAEIDSEVVGMGNLDPRGSPPTIWKLYVLPGRHGTGVGSALLHALVQAAPSEASAIVLEYVDGNDRAAAFYARHGFVEVRRESAATAGEPDTVWMERRLEGVGR